MIIDPVSAGLDLVKTLADKIWPDQAEREKNLLALEQLKADGKSEELNLRVQLLLAQIDVNKAQASSGRIFVAGARPFIIWVGGISMAWAGLFHPLLTWVWAFYGIEGDMPPMIDPQWVMGILTALLGVSGMRTYEKKNGVQTDKL